jgi:hypothetical protein
MLLWSKARVESRRVGRAGCSEKSEKVGPGLLRFKDYAAARGRRRVSYTPQAYRRCSAIVIKRAESLAWTSDSVLASGPRATRATVCAWAARILLLRQSASRSRAMIRCVGGENNEKDVPTLSRSLSAYLAASVAPVDAPVCIALPVCFSPLLRTLGPRLPPRCFRTFQLHLLSHRRTLSNLWAI